jgi:hypothetical protein
VAEAVDPQRLAGGVWRDGRCLVMHKQARLPDRCVKSNQPAGGRRLRRTLSWHHPVIYVAILAGLLIYIILALVLRQTATVYIGLSDEWAARRRRRIILAWSLVLLGCLLVPAAAFLAESRPRALSLVLLSPPLILGAAFYGLLGARMVAPVRITQDYVWLKGVHPDYLAAQPDLAAHRPQGPRPVRAPH